MRRSLLRSLSTRRASTAAAFSHALFPTIHVAPVLHSHHIIARSSNISALLTQCAGYATVPPPPTNAKDTSNHEDEASGAWHDDGDGSTGDFSAKDNHFSEGGSAVDFAHTPSLRDALPPSALDLPETSFLKCLEKEMMDEKYRLDKEEGPPPVPTGWTMHHTEGTSFIYGRRVWMPPPSDKAPRPPAKAKDNSASTDGSDAPQEGDTEANAKASDAPVPRAIEKHFLRLQLTTRDASLDPECDVRGEHFPFSFFVQRVKSEKDGAALEPDHDEDAFDEHTFYHDSIEVRCDVVDGELIVDNVVYHGSPSAQQVQPASSPSPAAADGGANASVAAAGALRPHYANPFGGYPGPSLDETEEEVLDGVQSWLAERGVDDQLGEFVGQYAIWIEQAEYELWLQQLHDYVAA